MNIIVLVIDTLRYDHVGAHGIIDWIQTPNMDRLASRSWVFHRAFAASYPTYPHRTDVITGRYGDPFHPWMPLRFDIPTLPRLLSEEAGYCTQLIHDTPVLINGGAAFDWPFHAWEDVRGASTDRPWIDDRGFEYLGNWTRNPDLDHVVGPEMDRVTGHTLVTYSRANRDRERPEDWNAARLFLKASQFIRDNSRRDNFFLWLDCFDPHEPWDAPAEMVRLYDKTPGYDGRVDPRLFDYVWRQQAQRDPLALPDYLIDRLKACYAAKVTLVDRWFGVFLDVLEETGLMDNTAVILTSDHGTCLGEGGRYSKRIYYEIGEPEGHVPLMVCVPNRGSGGSDVFAQPQDIFSTVLAVAGVNEPEQTGGVDLLALATGSREGADAGKKGGAGGAGRDVALFAAAPYHGWKNAQSLPLFTVFADEWYLNIAARPADCRLFRYGSREDEASRHPGVVQKLRERGLAELAARNADPRLVDWFGSHGSSPFPEESCCWPGPPGWSAYWGRTYNQW